jgi:hypothetical protein
MQQRACQPVSSVSSSSSSRHQQGITFGHSQRGTHHSRSSGSTSTSLHSLFRTPLGGRSRDVRAWNANRDLVRQQEHLDIVDRGLQADSPALVVWGRGGSEMIALILSQKAAHWEGQAGVV